MYFKVVQDGVGWYWMIYDYGDRPVGISISSFDTEEECRQDIRAVSNATFSDL